MVGWLVCLVRFGSVWFGFGSVWFSSVQFGSVRWFDFAGWLVSGACYFELV